MHVYYVYIYIYMYMYECPSLGHYASQDVIICLRKMYCYRTLRGPEVLEGAVQEVDGPLLDPGHAVLECMCVYAYIYIYIFICIYTLHITYIHVYVYIYIYISSF